MDFTVFKVVYVIVLCSKLCSRFLLCLKLCNGFFFFKLCSGFYCV